MNNGVAWALYRQTNPHVINAVLANWDNLPFGRKCHQVTLGVAAEIGDIARTTNDVLAQGPVTVALPALRGRAPARTSDPEQAQRIEDCMLSKDNVSLRWNHILRVQLILVHRLGADGIKILSVLEIGPSIDASVEVQLFDNDADPTIPSRMISTFQLIQEFQALRVGLKHLAEHTMALAWFID